MKIIKRRKDGIIQSYWKGNIENLTVKNKYFRKVLYTGVNEQLVVMMIPAHTEIGNEQHKTHDQFFRIEEGNAEITINNKKKFTLGKGGGLVISAGTWHNIKNFGNTPLKLYTLYSPPNHPPKTIDKTRMDAILREREHK